MAATATERRTRSRNSFRIAGTGSETQRSALLWDSATVDPATGAIHTVTEPASIQVENIYSLQPVTPGRLSQAMKDTSPRVTPGDYPKQFAGGVACGESVGHGDVERSVCLRSAGWLCLGCLAQQSECDRVCLRLCSMAPPPVSPGRRMQWGKRMSICSQSSFHLWGWLTCRR